MAGVAKNIYLAGKIAPWSRYGEDDWRCTIVPELTLSVGSAWLNEYIATTQQWAVLPRAIFGTFHYVGPFFTSMEDCYGGHGGGLAYPHAIDVSEAQAWKHSSDTPIIRKRVTTLCLDAIRRADLIFAWIASPDCYGTLFEVGYAKALGKQVVVRFTSGDFFTGNVRYPMVECSRDPEEFDERPDPWLELWFTYFACDARLARGTPAEELQEALHELGWDRLAVYESPREVAFAEAWGLAGYDAVYPLIPQYAVKDGRYRLDFADVTRRIGIEIDGYTYHSDRAAFNRDRQRQRELEADGWRIIRFTGDDILTNVQRCVTEAAHFISTHGFRQRRLEQDEGGLD